MSEFLRITEQPSPYRHLESMPLHDLLVNINKEDQAVPCAVESAIPQIESLVSAIVDKLMTGGRLFYLGAGTSGRLAVVDASECPPTFGVPYGLIVAVIAGGEKAITNAVEFAEDDREQGWKDLQKHLITAEDIVVGLTASGAAPYVLGALETCKKNGIITGCIVCNPGSPAAKASDFAVEVIVGPEFVTGSTRMKSGTAQKLVLNMISTAAMIRLGRVEDNRMVNMQLTNSKLLDRGVRMIMDQLGIENYNEAKELLLIHGSVKKAVEKN
jgi:N-acetylmuramic acid 6-phosphate etherase